VEVGDLEQVQRAARADVPGAGHGRRARAPDLAEGDDGEGHEGGEEAREGAEVVEEAASKEHEGPLNETALRRRRRPSARPESSRSPPHRRGSHADHALRLRARPQDDTLYGTSKRSSGATMSSLPEILPVTDLRQDSASVLRRHRDVHMSRIPGEVVVQVDLAPSSP